MLDDKSVLAGSAEKFKRAFPQVSVQLQVDNTRRCCQAVVDGHVDVAVVGGVIPSDLEHLIQVTLHTTAQLACSDTHALMPATLEARFMVAHTQGVKVHRQA